MTIYLAGYIGRKPERLHELALQLDAVVCDIRYAPRSRAPHWNKEPLERLLGDVVALSEPVPAKGARGLWDWSPLEEIRT